MCQVKVSHSCGGGGGAALVVVGLVVVAGTVAVSLASAVAAVLSTLVWAMAAVGGLGVLATAGVWALREVLAYRADRREDAQVRLLLAARGIPIQSAPAMSAGPELAVVRRLPLPAGRGGVW
jgi:hypothetical protein